MKIKNNNESLPSIKTDKDIVDQYMYLVRYSERIYRKLIYFLKIEIDKYGYEDINSVQALIIFHIGNNSLTPSELKSRGYYMGSNISYNLKKLTLLKYIIQHQSSNDKRSIVIKLSSKGLSVYKKIQSILEEQGSKFPKINCLTVRDLRFVNDILSALEKFWIDQTEYHII